MSLAMTASQIEARNTAPDSAVNKWQVFRSICEARALLGPSDRALVVLNALLTFLPETVMTPDVNLVVFPSNAQLATRAHGMAAATLRRHLAVLVQTGLVIRRDSPNGKRYARKGREGVIETAYGFDLAPLVARAAEFSDLAALVADERRQRQLLRERITIARRDCAKLLETGANHCDGAAWEDFHTRYRQLAASPARSASHDVLQQHAHSLDALRSDIADRLEKLLKSQKKLEKESGSESQTERHIHNSDKEEYLTEEAQPKLSHRESQQLQPSVPLETVLDACPDICDYAIRPIHNWRDLHQAASVARAALGVSPDIWNAFRNRAGENEAAVVIAAILQRRERITRPGGYLRTLNSKLHAGQFSARPMLMALARERLTQAGAHVIAAASAADRADESHPGEPSGGFHSSPGYMPANRFQTGRANLALAAGDRHQGRHGSGPETATTCCF